MNNPLIPELYCSNLKASLAFYTEVLGFEILYQREEERFVMLLRQGAAIMLEEVRTFNDERPGRTWISASLELPFGRGINFQIQTNQIDELYKQVCHCNAKIFLPIEDKSYQVNDKEICQRQFIVLDPDGYMLRFSENLGKINNEK